MLALAASFLALELWGPGVIEVTGAASTGISGNGSVGDGNRVVLNIADDGDSDRDDNVGYRVTGKIYERLTKLLIKPSQLAEIK